MQDYFKKLQEAETALEEYLQSAEEGESEESAEKRQSAMQKASNIKRRMASAIRFEQRKFQQKA